MKSISGKWKAALGLGVLCAVLTACGFDGREKEPEEPQAAQAAEKGEIWIEGQPEEEESVSGDGSRNGALASRRIEEQTFQVDLNPLGQVTFASYRPDTARDPLEDVLFRLEKDGQAFGVLEGMAGDNIRANERFHQVEAVSFPDYNNDGYNDIIILCSYFPASGPQMEETNWEARIYRGNADGSFVLEKELSEAANQAVAEKTVKSILGFIGPGRGRAENAVPEWKQAYIDCISQQDPEQWQGYNLIYIDGDDIPELVLVGDSEAAGCRIVGYADGGVRESQLSRLGFSYIEKENLLCNSDGHMDAYYDVVYRLENGKLVLIAAGYYGAEDNSNVQYDENQEPIYQYEWNGVIVTREEYAKALNAVYDTARAKGGYTWGRCFSGEEAVKAILAVGE